VKGLPQRFEIPFRVANDHIDPGSATPQDGRDCILMCRDCLDIRPADLR
jgi:hypothetical protein